MAAPAVTSTCGGPGVRFPFPGATLSPLHFPPVPPPYGHHRRQYLLTLVTVLLALCTWVVLDWTDTIRLLPDLRHGGPSPCTANLSAASSSVSAAELPQSSPHRGVVASAGDPQGAAAATAKQSVASFYAEAGNFRCPQPQRYTKAEVARHATEDDLWIVVDGNVLDVSGFSQQHPGGPVLVTTAGGHDMAAVFAQFHDPTSVSLFASFCIGQIRR